MKTRGALSVILALIVVAMLSANCVTAQQITGVPGSPDATTTIDGKYLPTPPSEFRGEINLNAKDSKPYWPARVVPKL